MTLREAAIHLYLETQKQLQLDRVIRRTVQRSGSHLRIWEHSLDLASFRRVVVLGLGKAAVPMTHSVLEVLDSTDGLAPELSGVVVGPAWPERQDARLQYFQGGHPSPTGGSLKAAKAVLDLLSRCDRHCLVLVLLSGGASSLLEKPLDANMTESDAVGFHSALVHSGLPITEMNILRKHFSAVKGGRLAVAAEGATLCTLIVSDVPPDAPHMVGSGPTLPDPSTVADCRRLIAERGEALRFDAKILAYFTDPALPETPKPGDVAFGRAVSVELLSSGDLCRTASSLAADLGFQTTVDTTCDEWDYKDAAVYLLDRVRDLKRNGDPVCLISAGELSVKVGQTHGIGGRNLQFVLECARLAAERQLPVVVLSAGSDGIDGNSPAAGAVVDEHTVARAALLGYSVEKALAAFDSYPVLRALNDTIETGASGNNVRDLRVLLA